MAESLITRVSNLEIDMWHGRGKENPSVTTRLALIEDRLNRIARILDKITWITVGLIVTIMGQIILRILKLL